MQLKRAAKGSTLPQNVAGQVESGKMISGGSCVGTSKKSKTSMSVRAETKRASVARREMIRAHARKVLETLGHVAAPKTGSRTAVMQSQLSISQLKEGNRPQILREMEIVSAILEVVGKLLKKGARSLNVNKNGIKFL